MNPAPINSSFFTTLLEMLDGTRQVAMLEAYFDESERASGLLCVAGYAFASEQAKKFIKEWSRLFQRYGGFHMKEFAHGAKRFSGCIQSERDALMRDAVKLINRRMTVGVAVSCMVPEMKKLSPRWIRGFGNAYPVCCHWAMSALILALDKAGISD